jgi:hypothetical protein
MGTCIEPTVLPERLGTVHELTLCGEEDELEDGDYLLEAIAAT